VRLRRAPRASAPGRLKRSAAGVDPLGVQSLLLIPSLAAIAVGSWVAARLLAIAQRGGRLPEQLIGTALASSAMVAHPLGLLLAFAGASLDPQVTWILCAAAAAAGCAATGCVVAFVWGVFRSRSRWAARAAWSLLALAAAGAIAGWVRSDPGARAPAGDPLAGALVALGSALAFGWASGEALHQGWRLRRRAQVGAADPGAGLRFLVLGLGTAVGAAIDLALLGLAARGIGVADHPAPALLRSGWLFALSATALLTFAPPRRYLAWVGAARARGAAA
jgi:hypothetical protein